MLSVILGEGRKGRGAQMMVGRAHAVPEGRGPQDSTAWQAWRQHQWVWGGPGVLIAADPPSPWPRRGHSARGGRKEGAAGSALFTPSARPGCAHTSSASQGDSR